MPARGVRLRRLRDDFEAGVATRVGDVVFNGKGAARLPHEPLLRNDERRQHVAPAEENVVRADVEELRGEYFDAFGQLVFGESQQAKIGFVLSRQRGVATRTIGRRRGSGKRGRLFHHRARVTTANKLQREAIELAAYPPPRVRAWGAPPAQRVVSATRKAYGDR